MPDEHQRMSCGGFTLIELVLVLAVLAVVFAMAAPAVSGFGRGQALDREADRLLAAGAWARAQAAASAVVHRLAVEPDGRSYRVAARSPDGETPTAAPWGTAHVLPAGMNLTCARADGAAVAGIDFYPNGRITPAALTLADGRGRSVTVEAIGAADPLRRRAEGVTP